MKTLKDIKNLVGLDSHHNYGDIFKAVMAILVERDMLRDSLGDVENLLSNNGLLHKDLLTSLHKLLARPDATQPQLSEIRYVLHGDIQPCSVLYSDDTTTLLRLDEGDIMCETDTIEWSDSVTYRCQELLKASGLNKINLVRVSGHLAQLVRDERILLNDDALETNPNAETIEAMGKVFVEALIPQCHTPKQER